MHATTFGKPRSDEANRYALVKLGIAPYRVAHVVQRDKGPVHVETRRARGTGLGIGRVADPRRVTVEPEHRVHIDGQLDRLALRMLND